MVSRSGFYAYLRRKGRGNPAEGVELIAQVREIYRESKGTYGSRRTAKRLQQKGYAVGGYKARTLMRQAGIAVRKKKRFKLTTDSRHGYPIAPNLLDRQFEVRQPVLSICKMGHFFNLRFLGFQTVFASSLRP